jgi:hypothetical protein
MGHLIMMKILALAEAINQTLYGRRLKYVTFHVDYNPLLNHSVLRVRYPLFLGAVQQTGSTATGDIHDAAIYSQNEHEA